MLCMDRKSSFWVPNFLTNKRKETGVKALHEYQIMAENQTGKKLRRIRINGGRELNNWLVDQYCAEFWREAASMFIYTNNFVPST